MIDQHKVEAILRRPIRGPGKGGGSVWTTDPWQNAHAEKWCREYARDVAELGLFLEALGLGAP